MTDSSDFNGFVYYDQDFNNFHADYVNQKPRLYDAPAPVVSDPEDEFRKFIEQISSYDPEDPNRVKQVNSHPKPSNPVEEVWDIESTVEPTLLAEPPVIAPTYPANILDEQTIDPKLLDMSSLGAPTMTAGVNDQQPLFDSALQYQPQADLSIPAVWLDDYAYSPPTPTSYQQPVAFASAPRATPTTYQQPLGPAHVPWDPADTIVVQTNDNFAQKPYRNAILNEFQDPARPLKVWDTLQVFDTDTQLALQFALEDERVEEQAKVKAEKDEKAEARGLLTNSTSHDPKNNRMFNRARLQQNAREYNPLPHVPSSWGRIDLETGESSFRYTPAGELLPGLYLSSEQMSEYIFGHRKAEIGSTARSNLILWIQSVPSDSVDRYPNPLSSKCRFKNCQDSRNTIRKGDFRVCFDEQPNPEINKDPYHNAGYVHLYCLESFCALQDIAQWVDIRPDTREFTEGKNRMAITRDHQCQEDVVLDYLSKNDRARNGNSFDYKKSLNYMLTIKQLSLEPRTRQETRRSRGGNHIDKHLNDLEIYRWNDDLMRERKSRGETMEEHEWRTHGISVHRVKHKRDLDEEVEVQPVKRQRKTVSPRPRSPITSPRLRRSPRLEESAPQIPIDFFR